MAITGAILVLFLIAHMYGNLMIFGGQEAFDEYSHHLRVLGAPMLPTNGFLWIMRVVLLASVLIHMYAAFTLWNRARQATAGKGSRRYHSKKNRTGVQRTYASFTMRWGGVVIALFVLYHLLHLTTNHIAEDVSHLIYALRKLLFICCTGSMIDIIGCNKLPFFSASENHIK